MQYQFLSYLATALVLLGVYFISKPKIRGQWIMLLANIVWLTYAGLTGQWGLITQSVVLFYLASSSIINWKKKGIEL